MQYTLGDISCCPVSSRSRERAKRKRLRAISPANRPSSVATYLKHTIKLTYHSLRDTHAAHSYIKVDTIFPRPSVCTHA
eukprot:16444489-Heterocapsa_arctica.AAC.1